LPKLLIIAISLLALVAIEVAATRFLWRTPQQESWSGTLLGGPESAMAPRVSPDGGLMAFQAFVGEITQVAVMKPETGNWTVLTHNSERGYVNEIAWSPDGTRLYLDRVTGVPNGVFAIPVLGGEEHLLLEDAMAPQKLPDGSLLVLRLNTERKQQVFRFWPETGQLRPFPVEATGNVPQVRVFPDGREAVVQGNYLGTGQPPGQHIFLLDLASGGVRGF